jgi:hypothetical protein
MRHRLEDLHRDIRYGLRLLARHRSFTLIAGLTLAFGIGATSAIFSVLHASVPVSSRTSSSASRASTR